MSQKYSEDYDIEWETPDHLKQDLQKELKSLNKNVITRNIPKNKKRIQELTDQIEGLKSFEVKKNVVSKCEGDGNNSIETDNYCIRRITYRENDQFFDIRPKHDKDFCKVKDFSLQKRPFEKMSVGKLKKVKENMDQERGYLQIMKDIDKLWRPYIHFLGNLKNLKMKKSIISNFLPYTNQDIIIHYEKYPEGHYSYVVKDPGRATDKLMNWNSTLEFFLLTIVLKEWGGIGHQCLIISEWVSTETYNIIIYDPSGIFSNNLKVRESLLYYLKENEYRNITYNYIFDFESGKYSIQFGPTCMLYSWKLYLLLCLNGPKIKQRKLSSLTLIDYLRDQSNEEKKQLVGTLYTILYFLEVYYKLLKKISPELKMQFINTNNDICNYLENVGCQIPDEFYLEERPPKKSSSKKSSPKKSSIKKSSPKKLIPKKSSPKKSSLKKSSSKNYYNKEEYLKLAKVEKEKLNQMSMLKLTEKAKVLEKPWESFQKLKTQLNIDDSDEQALKDILMNLILPYILEEKNIYNEKSRPKKSSPKKSSPKKSSPKKSSIKKSSPKKLSPKISQSVNPEQQERNNLRKLSVSELEELAKLLGKPWNSFQKFDSQSKIGDNPGQVTKKDFLVVAIAAVTTKQNTTGAGKKRVKKTKRKINKKTKRKKKKY